MIYKKILLVLSVSIISLSLISCNKKNLSIDATENSTSIETNNLKEENEEVEETVSINKEEVINKLCSDKFEGRWIGSVGNELAGEYINDLFGQIGLIPIFNDSYKEEYTQEVYKNSGLIAEDDYGEVKTINNIVGKIEGNSNNAIVISAHFDHIGIQDGKIIRGAIDNASGVAVLLDLAEILNNLSPIKISPFILPIFILSPICASVMFLSFFINSEIVYRFVSCFLFSTQILSPTCRNSLVVNEMYPWFLLKFEMVPKYIPILLDFWGYINFLFSVEDKCPFENPPLLNTCNKSFLSFSSILKSFFDMAKSRYFL